MQISKYFLNASPGNPGQRIDNRGVLFDLLVPAQAVAGKGNPPAGPDIL
jgi:hypothetical protein